MLARPCQLLLQRAFHSSRPTIFTSTLLLRRTAVAYPAAPISDSIRLFSSSAALTARPKKQKPAMADDSESFSEDKVAKYIPIIDSIFAASDLSAVTVKQVRNALAEKTGSDLTERKKQIDKIIKSRFDAILDAQQPPSPASAPSPSSDASYAAALSASLNPAPRSTRSSATTTTKRSSAATRKKSSKSSPTVDSDSDGATPKKKKRRTNPNNAFMRPLILKPPLADFVGEQLMSRTAVVKKCWDYIKEKGLQDPQDKRYILCDDKMKGVFGERVHMFTMNKVLSGFMEKPEDVVGGVEMLEEWKRNHPELQEGAAEVKEEDAASSEGVKSEVKSEEE